MVSRFLCDQEAHRLTALHCGDFGRGERSSGTGQARHAPRSGWLSPAFILSASSRERRSHVVGPDGDPSLPDDTGANRARGRRILLRSLTPLESAPHEQDMANLSVVRSTGIAIPITKCCRRRGPDEVAPSPRRANFPPSFRGARLRASPESISAIASQSWIPGLRRAAHPGMTSRYFKLLLKNARLRCQARSELGLS